MSTQTTPTSLPTPETADLRGITLVEDFLTRHPSARLLADDGDQVEMPRQLRTALYEIAAMLATGSGVAINAISREVSSTEAAKVLGMSRPTLVRLLDRSEIPSHRVGSHRRIFLHDVLAYRRRQLDERRRSYEALMIESDALGLDHN